MTTLDAILARFTITVLLAAVSLSEPAAAFRSFVFVGSTPCGEAIRRLLDIPEVEKSELIEWELSLFDSAPTDSVGSYELRYRFGKTRPNQPGLDADADRRERRGTWKMESGIPRRPGGAIVTLDGGVSLLRVSDTVLHLLEANGSLMVGNGGWSYTLSRRDAIEKSVPTTLTAADPGDPPRTTSHETGPTVLGMFDGRTPCQGIARELGVAARPGCWKAKWRLTLFHDPQTKAPTTYRLEGTLYRSQPREGSWRVVIGDRGAPAAEIYELAASNGESPARLLKGDERVLFFLGRDGRPLTGNARNAYTLDAR